MIRIEDMSEPERQSWITLLADGCVFAYLAKATLVGWLPPEPRDFTPTEFNSLMIGVVILTIFLHAVIAGSFALRERKEKLAEDERDTQIAALGARTGYNILTLLVGVVIVAGVIGYGSRDLEGFVWNIDNMADVIILMTVAAYAADLIRHGVMLIAYRR